MAGEKNGKSKLGDSLLNAMGLEIWPSCLMSYSPSYTDNTVKALWLSQWHQGLNNYVYFNVLIILNGNWIIVDFSLFLTGTSCFIWTPGCGQGLSPWGTSKKLHLKTCCGKQKGNEAEPMTAEESGGTTWWIAHSCKCLGCCWAILGVTNLLPELHWCRQVILQGQIS